RLHKEDRAVVQSGSDLDVKVRRHLRHLLPSSGGAADPPRKHHYTCTFPRCFFSSARLRFDSRIRFLNFSGRGDFLRLSFSRMARFSARFFARCCWIASAKRSRAIRRFIACERESCTVTLIPVGRGRRRTPVGAFFTFLLP